jgi:urease subunit beta
MNTQQNHGFVPNVYVPVGGVALNDSDIEYNCNRTTKKITVRNTGDRPIQVGSHYHFFEVNRYLQFDRMQAFGFHLNIPATTAIRFEPGDEKEVELVSFGGKLRIIGFNGLTMGFAGIEGAPTYYPVRVHAKRRLKHRGFKNNCDCGEDCTCSDDNCTCGDDCTCSDDNCKCNNENQ